MLLALVLGCGARPGSDGGDTTGKTGTTGNAASGNATNTSTDSDSDGASDSCELTQGTDPLNAAEVPDFCPDSNTSTLCMLYEEQKKQNELAENPLYDVNCTEKTTTDSDGGQIVSEECTYNSQIPQAASTLNNYGDANAATIQTLNIKLTYGNLYRDLVFIQNGIITIKPWYHFHNERKTHDVVNANRSFWGKLFDSITLGYLYGGLSLGILTENSVEVADYHYNHLLGAEASAGNDCPEDIVHKAIVNINGTDYTWLYPGYTPFRIQEYIGKYAPSTDAVKFSNVSTDHEVPPPLVTSFQNGFYDMTHIMTVINKNVARNKNHGCRKVTLDFVISYYKANGSGNLPNQSDLDKLCNQYEKSE